MNTTAIFLTGLFAGGLTCLAFQGGLLASSMTQREENKHSDATTKTKHFLPVLSFLITRLAAYTLLGFLLGALGSIIQFSLTTRAILQIIVSLFMIGTALNLLHIHPIFRYFVIQPPRLLTRIVRNQSKSTAVFGPALLGAFTVFIPCGATQAMMAYAISTGSALSGATTLFAFILGTSPLFFILGVAVKKFGSLFNENFNYIAATAMLLIAFYSLNNSLTLSGVSSLWENHNNNAQIAGAYSDQSSVSSASIYLTQSGYQTNPVPIIVKSKSKIKLSVINQDGRGCIQAFTIPSLRIEKIIPAGSSDTIEFTAPEKPGVIAFMCSMGMFRGSIQVI